ncbi:MAG: hypothetical protein ABH950_07250 [Candidatus Altiarchaeota archaeon]
MDRKTLMTAVLMLSLIGLATAQSETTQLQNALSTILCVIVQLLIFIAGGIAIVIIVLNGIKWTASSDDPGARKQAKQGIVHAIVGLIIVLIAIFVVTTIVGAGNVAQMAIMSGCSA